VAPPLRLDTRTTRADDARDSAQYRTRGNPAMPWKYTMSSSHATHVESGETFGIDYVSNNIKSSLDFELVPPAGSARTWSAVELDLLREELWTLMREEFEQADLRAKLSSLIKNPLIGDNYQAADVISRISGKHASQRSIQAWLIESDKRSSRKCPPWAVSALETYLAEPENQKRLRDLVNYYKAAAAPAAAQPAGAREEAPAGFAGQNTAADDRRREEWQRANLAALPGMLFELEQKMNGHISHFSKTLDAITATVLDEGKDLDDIKRSLRLKLDDLRHADFIAANAAGPLQNDGDGFS
jgi:hypothetical protein